MIWGFDRAIYTPFDKNVIVQTRVEEGDIKISGM